MTSDLYLFAENKIYRKPELKYFTLYCIFNVYTHDRKYTHTYISKVIWNKKTSGISHSSSNLIG